MDSLFDFYASQGIDLMVMLKTCGILILGTTIISLISRLLFGKYSILNSAISSAVGILFIYTLQIVLYSLNSPFSAYIPPLPFTSFTGSQLNLFVFAGAPYTIVCFQLLSMIILAFIMNLVDCWVPVGKNILTWLAFRILTIFAAVFVHNIVVGFFVKCMPEGIITYAPTILLAILVIMVLTGALKLLVGAIMATVNPIIAALYTFFFANLVGKQITRAVLTTAILSGVVYFMNVTGINTISIAPIALVAYIPFALVLVIMWHIVHSHR